MPATSKNPLPPCSGLPAEASNRDQIFRDATIGLGIFDRDLRYLQVNEKLAGINGASVAQHFGKTLSLVNAQVASALGPILEKAMTDNCVLEQMETEAPVMDDYPEPRYFQIACYPVRGEGDKVLGALAQVQDVSATKLKDAAQDELLKFEALLSQLSAAFINVPVAEMDRKIEEGLQKIVHFLGFDRSTIWLFSPEDGRLHSTHSYALPGIRQPKPVVDYEVPVWTSMCLRGEIFKVSDVEELPREFWREKQYCREMGGIKSFLFIPLNVGGTVVGLLSFASCRVKKTWSDPLIQRLRIFWEIFGNALERKRADETIQKALAEIQVLKERLEAENLYLRDQIDIEYKHEEIIGQSPAIREVLGQAAQVSATSSTVLILGETGTGKELLARLIHNLSGRRARAMIKLNCAALPASLIESELFGREKGAFTGAMAAEIGRFEAADGSTIFLDEIGELPLELQAKLLRVLQEGQFERLGSSKPVTVDVRVIAATNRDLAKEVREGKFREDLYYRLNVFPISVPPLRERREDIPMLVWSMVQEFGKTFGKNIEGISKKNMDALEQYGWPGNIRELRNMIERAMILAQGTSLVVALPEGPDKVARPARSLAEIERQHILSVMESVEWRVRGKGGASEILGVRPTTLDARMKKLGIIRKHV